MPRKKILKEEDILKSVAKLIREDSKIIRLSDILKKDKVLFYKLYRVFRNSDQFFKKLKEYDPETYEIWESRICEYQDKTILGCAREFHRRAEEIINTEGKFIVSDKRVVRYYYTLKSFGIKGLKAYAVVMSELFQKYGIKKIPGFSRVDAHYKLFFYDDKLENSNK